MARRQAHDRARSEYFIILGDGAMPAPMCCRRRCIHFQMCGVDWSRKFSPTELSSCLTSMPCFFGVRLADAGEFQDLRTGDAAGRQDGLAAPLHDLPPSRTRRRCSVCREQTQGVGVGDQPAGSNRFMRARCSNGPRSCAGPCRSRSAS